MYLQKSEEFDEQKYSEISFEGIDKLLRTLKATGKNYDIDKIKKAYVYAKKLHEGQFRYSGEEYISHPVAVAEIVASLELDTDSLCAALLHDTVEDCGNKISLEEISKEFGEDVASLVDGLTKLVAIPIEDKEEQHIENLRKMFLAMSKDVRVIFIKLCDRLHNMRTLEVKIDSKRRVTSLETMQVFAPLAHRLGMQRIKQELENLSLLYLDPYGYDEVKTDIERKYGESRQFLEEARNKLAEKLTSAGIRFTLEGRVKSVYSIYKKMYEQNKSFDQIYDFYALRVIVDTVEECYLVLGLIHDVFNMIPGRFKDYISTPKPNMYRSLHTTVIGHNSTPFEVQIRTWEMHQIAEFGVAAHWKYKSGEESKAEFDRKLSWIAKLIETEDETRDPEEFISALKTDILHDDVFVFTPKGDIITLPQGATVIDFAYAIHSEVGHKMIGAKINGMIVPIDKAPSNGEIVEILTSSASKGPSRDWLNIVQTGEARNKIRQWFKKEKRTENIAVGKSEIDKEFRKLGRNCTEAEKQEVIKNLASRVGMQDPEDMFNAIGYGGLSVSKLITKLKDEFEKLIKDNEPDQIIEADQIQTVKRKRKSTGGVTVDGVDGCTVKFAKCCNPLPGDKIVGFITKGFGVSIHKFDCPNVTKGMAKTDELDRWISAKWDGPTSSSGSDFEAALQITAISNVRLLADITSALADMHVSLLSIATRNRDALVIISLTVACKDLDHLKSIISRLSGIQSVESVVRSYI